MSSRRRHGAGHQKYRRTVAGQPSYRLGARVLLGKKQRLELTQPCDCRCHTGVDHVHPGTRCRCNAGDGYQP